MPNPMLKELRRAVRSRLPIPRSWLFSCIYNWGRWGHTESRSGPGSSLAYTQNLRDKLPSLLSDLHIRTMLDAPCGDFYWMSQVSLNLDQYIGADIVPAMIRDNRRRYERRDCRFMVLDIAEDKILEVDLIFCRDCLFHFPIKLAQKALRNFRKSGSRYLLTTTFPDGVNKNIASGYHYHINLQAPSFGFPPPLRSIGIAPRNQPARWLCGSYAHCRSTEYELPPAPSSRAKAEDFWPDDSQMFELAFDCSGQAGMRCRPGDSPVPQWIQAQAGASPAWDMGRDLRARDCRPL